MKTLVLGIGNVLLTDEGIGIHVIRYLEKQHPKPDVTYLDGGTLGLTLAGHIEESESLIVVDAINGHVEPGAIMTLVGADMDRFLGRAKRSVHEVGLIDLMNIVHLTDHIPGQRALVGIQPKALGWGINASEPVTQAIPKAASEVLRLIETFNRRAL